MAIKSDDMKHCSIEWIDDDLYRLKIVGVTHLAKGAVATMTITRQTLDAIARITATRIGCEEA